MQQNDSFLVIILPIDKLSDENFDYIEHNRENIRLRAASLVGGAQYLEKVVVNNKSEVATDKEIIFTYHFTVHYSFT